MGRVPVYLRPDQWRVIYLCLRRFEQGITNVTAINANQATALKIARNDIADFIEMILEKAGPIN